MNALVVGINKYDGSPLSGCANDAMDWDALLQSYGFQTKMLLDEQATKANIVEELRSMLASVKAEEPCVFTYSGHGSWCADLDGDEADRRDELLCPFDMNGDNVILDDEIHELLANRTPGSRFVGIFDSCHSGTVSRNPFKGKPRFMPPSKIFSSPSAYLTIPAPMRRQHQLLPGVVSFSACGDRQYAADAEFDNRPNGAFSYYLIRAIRSLSVTATYADVQRALRESLPSTEFEQKPELHATASMKRRKLFS